MFTKVSNTLNFCDLLNTQEENTLGNLAIFCRNVIFILIVNTSQSSQWYVDYYCAIKWYIYYILYTVSATACYVCQPIQLSDLSVWFFSLWITVLWNMFFLSTDFDQTSPVDFYGQCLGWVRSRPNFVHTNELCCHLIGRYCLCTISNHFYSRLSIVHLVGASGYLHT
jgi:hypothetical protein